MGGPKTNCGSLLRVPPLVLVPVADPPVRKSPLDAEPSSLELPRVGDTGVGEPGVGDTVSCSPEAEVFNTRNDSFSAVVS